jgi:ketosteroid isomerase-like protein
MKSFLPLLVVAFLVATIALPIARPTVSASPKATADTLKRLEGEFMKAAAEKGSQGYMSYYADDAVEVPNGGPLIQGKAEIAKGMGFLDDKTINSHGRRSGADISASGDLGYTYGTTNFTRRTRRASRSWNTASTPASGSCRRTEAGRLCSIWGMRPESEVLAPLLLEVILDRLGLGAGDDCGQCRGIGLLDGLHAAEMFEQAPRRACAYTGDFEQFGGAVAHLAALAMEGYGEAVRLIANELNQMKHGRVMVEGIGSFS